jgi:hypothetical protein
MKSSQFGKNSTRNKNQKINLLYINSGSKAKNVQNQNFGNNDLLSQDGVISNWSLKQLHLNGISHLENIKNFKI